VPGEIAVEARHVGADVNARDGEEMRSVGFCELQDCAVGAPEGVLGAFALEVARHGEVVALGGADVAVLPDVDVREIAPGILADESAAVVQRSGEPGRGTVDFDVPVIRHPAVPRDGPGPRAAQLDIPVVVDPVRHGQRAARIGHGPVVLEPVCREGAARQVVRSGASVRRRNHHLGRDVDVAARLVEGARPEVADVQLVRLDRAPVHRVGPRRPGVVPDVKRAGGMGASVLDEVALAVPADDRGTHERERAAVQRVRPLAGRIVSDQHGLLDQVRPAVLLEAARAGLADILPLGRQLARAAQFIRAAHDGVFRANGESVRRRRPAALVEGGVPAGAHRNIADDRAARLDEGALSHPIGPRVADNDVRRQLPGAAEFVAPAAALVVTQVQRGGKHLPGALIIQAIPVVTQGHRVLHRMLAAGLDDLPVVVGPDVRRARGEGAVDQVVDGHSQGVAVHLVILDAQGGQGVVLRDRDVVRLKEVGQGQRRKIIRRVLGCVIVVHGHAGARGGHAARPVARRAPQAVSRRPGPVGVEGPDRQGRQENEREDRDENTREIR